jgi:hypothetical protein
VSIPDLGKLFISLNSSFQLFGFLVIALIAFGGMFAGFRGLMELWELAMDENRMTTRGSTLSGGFFKILLGSMMVVMPILFVRTANTFVLGGEDTFNMFNYVLSGGTDYCADFRWTVSNFFKAIGIVAWGFALSILYSRTNGQGQTASGNPWYYLIGGVLCFFIDDVAVIMSNTTGYAIGLDNICNAIN